MKKELKLRIIHESEKFVKLVRVRNATRLLPLRKKLLNLAGIPEESELVGRWIVAQDQSGKRYLILEVKTPVV